mgnify:CR=1 FL=1
MKFLLKYFLFLIFLFFFLAFSVEIYARYKNPSWHVNDQILGWNLKKNFKHTYIQTDQRKNTYEAKIETNKYSLRFNNKKKTNRPDILVIGDSFVADPYVSNEKMWFSILAHEISKKENREVTVLAGGGGGFATYQEFLLSQRLSRILKPKIFILQFCSNDFGANVFEVENSKSVYNTILRRPYPINEKSLFNSSLLAKVARTPIIGDSKIFNYLLFRYGLIMEKYKSTSTNISEPEEKKLKKKMERITLFYLKKIRQEFNNSKAFMVNCEIYSDVGSLNLKWKDYAIRAGFIPIEEGNVEIEKKLKNKANIFYRDGGHWNELGNYIFGKNTYNEIAKYIN